MVGEGSHRGGWKHGKAGERARRLNVHEVPLGEEKQFEHMRGSQKDGQDPRGQLEKETGSEQQLGKHLPSPRNDLEQKMERVMSVVLRPPQPPAPLPATVPMSWLKEEKLLLLLLSQKVHAQLPRVWGPFFHRSSGQGELGHVCWTQGGHSVCCPAGSSRLPARPIEGGGERSPGERGAGWGRCLPPTLRGSHGGLPLGLQRKIWLGTWQQGARHGTKEQLCLGRLCW